MSRSKPDKVKGKSISGKRLRQLSGQEVRDSRCPSKNQERKEVQKDQNPWTAQSEGRVWEE